MFERCAIRIFDPLWKIREQMTGVSKKVKYDRELIRNKALEIIEKRRREGHPPQKDFLQIFMEGEDNEGKPLSNDLLIDNALTFTAAGRDNTAISLTWMMYLICRDGADRNIAKTLIQEVDEILEGSDPTYETYKRQRFAEACFHEVPRNLRFCVKDDVLPDGTKVHAGEWITWSSYVMGRSELIWGPDAKEFKPSRWINNKKPSQGKFNSFHAGPRVCPGQRFATIQALTIIGMILQSFDVRLEEPSKMPSYGTSLVFVMREGLKIRVTRRNRVAAV
ncbi:Protein kinase alk2 [Gryganskiella cystojenkinii]|nr:Protein kinase alk2 [Gryganskiella cystojenkinii]